MEVIIEKLKKDDLVDAIKIYDEGLATVIINYDIVDQLKPF